MKISLHEIDYSGDELFQVLDLSKGQNYLTALYLFFANGLPKEVRIEGDSEEALEIVKGVAQGGGSCDLVEIPEEIKKNLKLYKPGDECYEQWEKHYCFINPIIKKISE